MTYIPISSQIRQISQYRVHLAHLELQDYDTINLDQVTVINLENLFSVKKMEYIPYEMPNNVWTSVTFDLSLDLITYERKVYTAFDMFSDVGGLLGLLVSFFSLLSWIWNYQSFDNYLASRLFKIKRESEDEADFIKLSSLPNLLSLLSCLPSPSCCKKVCDCRS